jgi:hypothetical protein
MTATERVLILLENPAILTALGTFITATISGINLIVTKVLRDHINSKMDLLLKAKEAESVAKQEIARLSGEASGRKQAKGSK